MEDSAIKAEFERLRDEDKRQNKRLDELERIVDAVHSLAIDVSRQTEEIKHMNAQLLRLSEDVATLKAKPAQRWESVVGSLLGALIGAFVALVVH